MPIWGITASAMSGHLSSFESIATVTVGAGGQSTVSFSSIPSTYQHLQIRAIFRSTQAANNDYIRFRFNSDTGSNYANHYLRGDGASATAGAYTSTNAIYLDPMAAASLTSGIFGVVVMDILDYSTSGQKYKTTRFLGGYDANGSGYVNIYSGLWQNTNAVTDISMAFNSGNFAQYTQAALFGVKA